MERTKHTSDKLRWKKVGGGSLRILGKIIKPGEVFTASLDEIPIAFRDVVLCLDEQKLLDEAQQKELEYKKSPIIPSYEVKARKEGSLWHDVVDKQGKRINEKALKKEDAEELLRSLEA